MSEWAGYIDEDWLATVDEDILEPDIPIIDAHHHFMAFPFEYDLTGWKADTSTGHNIVGSVHVEASGHYRKDGPEHLRPIGETEYFVTRIGTAIADPAVFVGGGTLDMDIGKVRELLDAHDDAGAGRFRGMRAQPFWTFSTDGKMKPAGGWEGALERPDFIAAAKELARRDLSLDLVCYHSNLTQAARLAAEVPELRILIDHLGTVIDPSGSRDSDDLFAEWRAGITTLAGCSNVFVKLGGCANPMIGRAMPKMRAILEAASPATSLHLADAYREQFSYLIDTIGLSRCLFESNFPIDKRSASYAVVWNAFKRLSSGLSLTERMNLFSETARSIYRIGHN